LKARARRAEEETEAAGGVDQVRGIAEEPELFRVVVNRVAAGGRILNAEIALEVTSREIVVPFAAARRRAVARV